MKGGVDLNGACHFGHSSGLCPGGRLNPGKILFSQLMDFLLGTIFARYVVRYGGERGVWTLTWAEQFRIMAFAQRTYRESLRYI